MTRKNKKSKKNINNYEAVLSKEEIASNISRIQTTMLNASQQFWGSVCFDNQCSEAECEDARSKMLNVLAMNWAVGKIISMLMDGNGVDIKNETLKLAQQVKKAIGMNPYAITLNLDTDEFALPVKEKACVALYGTALDQYNTAVKELNALAA